MLAKASPNPKCEARAAKPSPAARPATGPIQLRLGAAAAPGAAAAAVDPATGAACPGVLCALLLPAGGFAGAVVV